VSSDGYILNVQCHKGLTYHFQFLTFGHSGRSGLSARVPEWLCLITLCLMVIGYAFMA